MNTVSRAKPREGGWLWIIKMVGGLMIVGLIILHMIVNHLVAPGGLLSYQDVLDYYNNPIIPILEIAFLIFVVSHALIGLRSILLDLNPSDKVLRIINWSFLLLGCGVTAYGTWLAIFIASK